MQNLKKKQIKDIMIQNIKLVSFMNIINTNYIQFCEYCWNLLLFNFKINIWCATAHSVNYYSFL